MTLDCVYNKSFFFGDQIDEISHVLDSSVRVLVCKNTFFAQFFPGNVVMIKWIGTEKGQTKHQINKKKKFDSLWKQFVYDIFCPWIDRKHD